MDETALAGCRILVAEDEYFLAADTARLLRQAGATIVGPVGTVAQVEEQVRLDAFDVAVLDIRLDQELVYPAADLILQSRARVVFFTGYDKAAVPARFAGVAICQKPCPDEALIEIVRGLCAGSSTRAGRGG